jgi:hypothetical protein
MEGEDSVIRALAAAGSQGLTPAELAKTVAASKARISQLLGELRCGDSVRGPFRIGRSSRYFSAAHAPSREQVEARIDEQLLNAGLKLTTQSDLEKAARPCPKAFFTDALSALKAEGKIVEFRNPRKSRLYVHREPLLEQLHIERESTSRGDEPRAPVSSLPLDRVLRVYEAAKAQQGGISAVTIYDLLKGVGGSKEELHRLLLDAAAHGRATLHPASTVNFPPEVMEAGITIEGQPYPFVTVVLKEGT